MQLSGQSFKMILTFVLGVASGLGIASYADFNVSSSEENPTMTVAAACPPAAMQVAKMPPVVESSPTKATVDQPANQAAQIATARNNTASTPIPDMTLTATPDPNRREWVSTEPIPEELAGAQLENQAANPSSESLPSNSLESERLRLETESIPTQIPSETDSGLLKHESP